MRKLVIRILLFVIFLLLASLSVPEEGLAQNVKTTSQKNMKGRVVQTPYIDYEDFQSSSLGGGGQGKIRKDASGFLSGRTFRDILSVPSIDEAIHLLGKPKATDRNSFSDGGGTAVLQYEEGTFFEYRKYENGTFALLEFQLWDANWSLKIGETKLRPGMEIDSLSSAVHQSIREGTYPDGADVDGIGIIRIAKPGAARNDEAMLLQDGKAQITVHVNREEGIVEVVRFTRLGPW